RLRRPWGWVSAIAQPAPSGARDLALAARLRAPAPAPVVDFSAGHRAAVSDLRPVVPPVSEAALAVVVTAAAAARDAAGTDA
ncbi:MAG: hypothetical protein ABS888_05880, partial [Eubacteriales bacterium]